MAGAFTATYNVNNKPYTISPSAGGTQVYYYDQNGDRGLIADGYSNIIGGGFYGAFGEHVSSGDSGANSEYIFFGTEPIWNSFVNTAGVTVYSEQVAQDRLGSVRLWGIQTTNLFPYGVEYTTTEQDHEKFATYIRDSFTGLDYARNRFYSSTLGRFTSADPSLSSVGLGNPLSWNRYAYVNGDPVNITDPSGLCSGGENMPNDSSCLVSAGDEGSNSSNTAPDPNGTATDSNGNTVGVQVEGTSITVTDTQDPVNLYDASVASTLQAIGSGAPTVDTAGNAGTSGTRAACEPPNVRGFGYGGIAGASALVGMGPNWSLGATASGGYGRFISRGGHTTGGFASAGNFLTDKGSLGNYPSNDSGIPNLAVGTQAGFGGGVFITNAGNSATLSGPFTSVLIGLPPILGGAGVEVDYSNGIVVLSLTAGKQIGVPVGVAVMQTNTFYTSGKPCQP